MELTFIQDCLGACLYPDRPMSAPPPQLNLERVHALSVENGVDGSLAAWGMAHLDLFPPALLDRLRQQRYGAVLRGERCRLQVARVLSALRHADIPVIVLKGWAYISLVYGGDQGQRSYADIDLLVQPADAARADGIMRELCYQESYTEMWPGYWRRYGGSRHYKSAGESASAAEGFSFDLHQGLFAIPFYDRRIPLEPLFRRARPVQVADVEVQALQAEDDLVHACGHLALHHRYEGSLSRYYEMAAVIRQAGPAFDWNAVVTRAVAWRLIAPLQRVVGHLVALWPGVLPVDALELVSALHPSLAERCVHYGKARHHDNPFVATALSALSRPGLRAQAGFVVESSFPGPAYLSQRYGAAPAGLWPLWYVWRATRAVVRLVKIGA
jgi:hypothetical protein